MYHMVHSFFSYMQFSVSFIIVCPSISFICKTELRSRFYLCIFFHKIINNNKKRSMCIISFCLGKTLRLGFSGKFPLWTETESKKNKKDIHTYTNTHTYIHAIYILFKNGTQKTSNWIAMNVSQNLHTNTCTYQ